jgi:hypothetical protein
MALVPTPAPIVSQTIIMPAPIAAVPAAPLVAAPVPQTAAAPRRAPALTPAHEHSGWQTIPPRSGGAYAPDRFGGYEPETEKPVPKPIDNEPGVRKTSWRGNIPAAVSARNFESRVR